MRYFLSSESRPETNIKNEDVQLLRQFQKGKENNSGLPKESHETPPSSILRADQDAASVARAETCKLLINRSEISVPVCNTNQRAERAAGQGLTMRSSLGRYLRSGGVKLFALSQAHKPPFSL